MYVLTVDQRRSRRDVDRVDALVGAESHTPLVRPFERTAGDEVQAVSDDPRLTTDLALRLVGDGHWSVGVGIGDVAIPMPESTRAGRGRAYEHARDAVERAKHDRTRLAVSGTEPEPSDRAQTAFRLLLELIGDRSAAGTQAVDLVRAGHTQSEAAAILDISPQAVSQRLRTARWDLENPARALITDLLARADTTSGKAHR